MSCQFFLYQKFLIPKRKKITNPKTCLIYIQGVTSKMKPYKTNRPTVSRLRGPRRAGMGMSLLGYRRDRHSERSWREGPEGTSLVTRCLELLGYWPAAVGQSEPVTILMNTCRLAPTISTEQLMHSAEHKRTGDLNQKILFKCWHFQAEQEVANFPLVEFLNEPYQISVG